jgi:hypothetical protein
MESIKENQLKTVSEFYNQCKALTEANLCALEEKVFYIYRSDNNSGLCFLVTFGSLCRKALSILTVDSGEDL